MKIDYVIRGDYAVIYIPYEGNKAEKGIYECLVDIAHIQDIINLDRCLSITVTSGLYVMFKKNNRMEYLHALLKGSKEGYIVDHINQNTLDNRSCNLRYLSRYLNGRNTDKHRVSRFGYKWVAKNRNKYAANVRHKMQKVYLGNYSTPLEAHRVANRWVYENIGSEFCVREAIKIPYSCE